MSTTPPTVAKTTFWSWDRVAQALRAHADENLPRGAQTFGRVWTDTRTIEPGDLFVALSGERFDAHDFLKDAVAKGASGVVVSKLDNTRNLGVPVYHVHDTLVALGALGNFYRRMLNAPVVGVVGTNGKTSTKELIRAALGARLRVHATTGNLNNLIGVPLTLLAMPETTDVAVIEMGTNQPGEVARLRAIVEPSIVVVTSVAEEHLEGLGDLEGVLREEMAATDGVAVAVVPASQPEVVSAAKSRAGRVVSAGVESDAEVSPKTWSVGEDGRGQIAIDEITIHLPLRGVHNVRNALLAIAVAREVGVSIEDAARGLEAMVAPPMRSNMEQHGAATLINDAYNSNPGSARAALELLQHAGKGRQRVAVLGTMLELGPSTPRLHEDVARDALNAGVEVVAAIGEFASALARIAPGDSRVITAGDVDELWNKLSPRLAPDAVILLKGSRGMRLERLVAPITDWAQRRATT